jgi:hypothetical protein
MLRLLGDKTADPALTTVKARKRPWSFVHNSNITTDNAGSELQTASTSLMKDKISSASISVPGITQPAVVFTGSQESLYQKYPNKMQKEDFFWSSASSEASEQVTSDVKTADIPPVKQVSLTVTELENRMENLDSQLTDISNKWNDAVETVYSTSDMLILAHSNHVDTLVKLSDAETTISNLEMEISIHSYNSSYAKTALEYYKFQLNSAMRQIEYYTSQLKKAHAAIASKDKKLHNISVEMQRLNQQHRNII